MNILQVTLGFYPALSWGGPVKVVYQNSRELIQRGHQVTVYCSNLLDKRHKVCPGTFERDIDGIRVVYLNTWNLPFWPGTLGPFWMPDLPHYLKNEIRQFDIVHINGYRSFMSLAVAMAARSARVPWITQPQGALAVKISSFVLKRLYDRILGQAELGGVSALIALQDREKEQALSHHVPTGRIEIIPNGIDPHSLDGNPAPGIFREKYGIHPDQPLFLFLGRINPIKGPDMLVKAFAKIRIPDARLVMVGPDDTALEDVKALVHQLRLEERVIFTGLISDEEKQAAYQDANLFVLSSRSDAYPTTVMEACLAGLPMVVTDRCEMAHLIKDRIAEVVPFDEDRFAAAMEKLWLDQDRYTQYKHNCPAMISEIFSIQAVVDRLESLYHRVILESGKGVYAYSHL